MDNFITIEGKKYMWDGEEYPSEPNAKEIATKYRDDGFQTQLLPDETNFLVYTRRVVKDVVVEGQP